MKEQLISFSTSKLAKEKGFDWPCLQGYTDKGESRPFGRIKEYYVIKDMILSNKVLPYTEEGHYPNTFVCTAPTQSLLQKWLREEHNYCITVIPIYISEYMYVINEVFENGFHGKGANQHFNTYEEALEEGLFLALKLIKPNAIQGGRIFSDNNDKTIKM